MHQTLLELAVMTLGCALGVVTGLLTGLSREPAVGAIVPSMLTFVGGVIAYLYTAKDSTKDLYVLYILAVTVIGMNFFYYMGCKTGAQSRAVSESAMENHQIDREYGLAEHKHRLELERLRYANDLEKDKMEYKAEIDAYLSARSLKH